MQLGQYGQWDKLAIGRLGQVGSMDIKKYAMMDIMLNRSKRKKTPLEKHKDVMTRLCQQIEQNVQTWCLGIRLANGIDITARNFNGQSVVLDKKCDRNGAYAGFETFSYGIIRPLDLERIEIKIGGECFKDEIDPKNITALSQFKYQIVKEDKNWRTNTWDLCIYVKNPEDVIRVLAAIEPHYNWEYA